MSHIVCPVLYVVHKTWTKINLGMKRLIWFTGHTPPLREVRAGTWRSELKSRQCRNAVSGLVPGLMFRYLPCASQDHLHRDRTTDRDLGPLTSTDNQENAARTCPHANLLAFFSIEPAQFIKSWWKKGKQEALSTVGNNMSFKEQLGGF